MNHTRAETALLAGICLILTLILLSGLMMLSIFAGMPAARVMRTGGTWAGAAVAAYVTGILLGYFWHALTGGVPR
jgi:hypothetical protein